jgi:hypothetical protein
MEIEFNPSRVGQPESAPPTVRSGPVRANRAEAPFPNTDAVEATLRDIPLARPGKVEQVKPLVSDLQYPPDQMLDGIAALLAMNI